jgi:hypothetical protein
VVKNGVLRNENIYRTGQRKRDKEGSTMTEILKKTGMIIIVRGLGS